MSRLKSIKSIVQVAAVLIFWTTKLPLFNRTRGSRHARSSRLNNDGNNPAAESIRKGVDLCKTKVFSCPCKYVSLHAACGGKVLCPCKCVFTASSRQSQCYVRTWCTQASMSETKRRGSCACISIGRGMPPGPPRVNAPMNLQVPSSGIIRQGCYLEQHLSRVSCQRRALCPL